MSKPPPLPRRMTERAAARARSRKHLLWSVALIALFLTAAFGIDLHQLTPVP